MIRAVSPSRSRLLIALWVVILLEIVSPVPLVLSVGAIYVVLFRPPWFPRMVQTLYDVPADRSR